MNRQQFTPPQSPGSATVALPMTLKDSSPNRQRQLDLAFSPGSSDDLSARCRALARSVGENAKGEWFAAAPPAVPPPPPPGAAAAPPSPSQQQHAQLSLSTTSPRMLSTPLVSPASSTSTRDAYLSPLSPRSLGPPTPDGSAFFLEGIGEEPEEERTPVAGDSDPAQDDTPSSSAPPSVTGSFTRPPLAFTDEEGDDNDAFWGRGRRSISSGSLGLNGLLSPIRSALNQGATNVTVDVWLVDGELLVGSDLATLSPEETLSVLYLEPLLDLFKQNGYSNGSPSRSHRRRSSTAARHITTAHPLHLFLQFKTEPSITFQYLLHALTDLNDEGLLTSFCPKSRIKTPGFITIVCTGPNIPLVDMVSISPRYVFAELPLTKLTEDTAESDSKTVNSLKDIYPVVSDTLVGATGWNGNARADEQHLAKIKEQVQLAHSRGFLIRYSNLPKWPSHTRELVRDTLRDAGVDFV
ncbi:hypothetical protein T439DRAFT_384085 [Meredithblackwellia eburnea MCA 4105]